MKAKSKLILLHILLTACCGLSYGQVTIGSGIEPVGGALLDLKQNNETTGGVTATKGMMLPRVNLTNLTDITTGDITGVTAANKDAHIGLTVYNLTQCDGKFAKGVWTWTGTQWVQLTKNPILTGSDPVLTFTPALPAGNPAFIEIPSGQDLRAAWAAAYAPSIGFAGTNQVTGAWANTVGGGLVFTTHPLSPSFPAIWTTSPVNDLSVWPDAMTAADLASNPWLTRASRLTITGIAGTGGGPCPGGNNQTQAITLNQTNYKIVPSTSTSTGTSGITPTTLVTLRISISSYLPIHSNVRWKATTNASKDQIDKVFNADLTSAAVKGGDKSDGTKYTQADGTNDWRFSYRGAPYFLNPVRYETVDVTFEDANTPKRAPDATVTFMQCAGTPDMSSVTTNADNAATSTTPAPAEWAGKVVRHAAKPGVYEEFYSAEFGAAGRWMTTNLAATAYDGIKHSTDPSGTATSGTGSERTLQGPKVPVEIRYDEAFWCYPGVTSSTGTNPGHFNENKHLGLLYTWDAATAGKGGISGTVQFGGEFNMEESLTDEPGKQKRLQGICPAGWHLPSQKEWTILENEIIRETTKYANTSTNLYPTILSDTLQHTAYRSEPYRTYYNYMIDFCFNGGLSSSDFRGLSKKPQDNGFFLLSNGYMQSSVFQDNPNFSTANQCCQVCSYWTSSGAGNGVRTSSARYRIYDFINVGRYNHTIDLGPTTNNRACMYGVRCKKD